LVIRWFHIAALLLAGFLWLGFAMPPAASVRFAAAGASGLDFILNNSPTTRKYLPETMAGGVVAFDYNNDGRLDLFFPNGAEMPSLVKTQAKFSNRLYRNDGNGHFTDVTLEASLAGLGFSIGAAAGDFDNDGYPDLFVAGVHESHLYRNIAGRRFEDVTIPARIHATEFAVGAAWFDFDRDGRLDLFILNYLRWSPQNDPGCHDPSGRYPVYCHPKFFTGTASQLYRNLGNGKFEDVSQSSGIAAAIGKGMGVSVADYDGDGYPDLFVTNDVEPNFLFHNLGNGRFSEVALDAGVALPDDGNSISGMGTDFRDYDNDGKPDIVFTALAGQTFPLFRNSGKNQFLDATHSSGLGRLTSKLSGWGITMADLNNDGWKDLFTANSHVTDNIQLFSGDQYQQPNSVFLNRGDGTFAAVASDSGPDFAVPRAHRGAVVADFDGDGRLDAVVSVLGRSPEFWRNTTPGAAHWIEFKLVGARSNHDGIGATIHIGRQWNTMTSSAGYASSCLCPVHFGLGAQDELPQVEILWPDGERQILDHVKADRRVTVTEGAK
jgi:enediyne biosynthesis protein E4